MGRFNAKKLVTKLTPGEAREFYFFAKKHGKTNKLVQLCKLIRGRKKLSDSELCAHMSIRESHLAAYLVQLSDLIFEFLAYKELKSIPGLYQYLKYVALKKRGFEEKGKKELEKGIPDSSMNFTLEEILPILLHAEPAYLEMIQHSQVYRDLGQLMQLKELKAKLDIGIKEVFLQKPHISAMESITHQYPILNQPESITDPRVKAEYHNVKRRILIFQQEWDQAEIHIRAFLNIVNGNLILRKELAFEAIDLLERLALIEISRGNYRQAQELLPDFQNYGDEQLGLLPIKEFAVCSLKLAINIEKGEQNIESGLLFPLMVRLKKKVPFLKHRIFSYSVALWFTMKGEWVFAEKVLHWYFRNTKRSDGTQEFRYAHLLHLVILFEQKRLIDLSDQLQKVKRNFEDEGSKFSYFRSTFSLFEQILSYSESGWEGLYYEWQAKFEVLKNDPNEALHFSFLNLGEWLESKSKSNSWIFLRNQKSLTYQKRKSRKTGT